MLIRFAEIRDALVITKFNRAMAFETEQKELIPEVISKGVDKLLNPNLGFYVVAERDNEVIGTNGNYGMERLAKWYVLVDSKRLRQAK